MAAKPVPQFLADWNEFLERVRQALSLDRHPLSLGIVGGGWSRVSANPTVVPEDSVTVR
ncbi:MAG: hypothetical protein HC852_17430 [Acaryochloridaceae cyanobacterium RU_4_10]|nr:hypothetical protein [Acaryochloridaceae cyanobacterium RU_4_10]